MKHFTTILLVLVAILFAGCKQQNNYLWGLSYYENCGTFYYEYYFDKEYVHITTRLRHYDSLLSEEEKILPYKITSPTSFYIDKDGFKDEFEYNPNTDKIKSTMFSTENLSRNRPE